MHCQTKWFLVSSWCWWEICLHRSYTTLENTDHIQNFWPRRKSDFTATGGQERETMCSSKQTRREACSLKWRYAVRLGSSWSQHKHSVGRLSSRTNKDYVDNTENCIGSSIRDHIRKYHDQRWQKYTNSILTLKSKYLPKNVLQISMCSKMYFKTYFYYSHSKNLNE